MDNISILTSDKIFGVLWENDKFLIWIDNEQVVSHTVRPLVTYWQSLSIYPSQL